MGPIGRMHQCDLPMATQHWHGNIYLHKVGVVKLTFNEIFVVYAFNDD